MPTIEQSDVIEMLALKGQALAGILSTHTTLEACSPEELGLVMTQQFLHRSGR